MREVAKIIKKWRKQTVRKIELGSLFSRNTIAYKWKATYRCFITRELVLWRFTDLMDQMVLLAKKKRILGAIILLRSALETLAILIYLNKKMLGLIDGSIDFETFSQITLRLLLGTKNSTTDIESVNILTVIQNSNKQYPGLLKAYENLSESTHPNFEGLYTGYSKIDEEHFVTYFEDRWDEKYSKMLKFLADTILMTFDIEYNQIWPDRMEKVEAWIEENDELLSNGKEENGT